MWKKEGELQKLRVTETEYLELSSIEMEKTSMRLDLRSKMKMETNGVISKGYE